MNKNNKLWVSVALTALITFPAGMVLGGSLINAGLVKAFGSVGENLFGEGNFGVSIVGATPPDDGSPAAEVVQIDIASGGPPDDNQPPQPVIPVYLNVFQPPTPIAPACVVSAQIAITSAGVEVIINDDPLSVPPDPILVSYGSPLGQPPDPCRDDGNVIGPGPG